MDGCEVFALRMTTTETDLQSQPVEELHAASVHLEDLEIFVGQRSRMHPGAGWATALALIRRDLAEVRAEIGSRASYRLARR